MTVYANNYLAIHKYMSTVVSNPKLNLTDAQKKSFQEVLNETTKELSTEYAKTSALTMQNNNIWQAMGASGANSSIYSNLLMPSIYGSYGGQTYSPYYGLNSLPLPSLFSSSRYLNNNYF
ncbi:hypothetical protein [Paenibacillus kobensis]|uniref:hypothetical protein n=1 Tax=Paenibacillus kobensis TaxID=59841 RepID=UPI000FD9ABB1|nr:hypothetical protein [Paenibacillus kobensis]